MFTGYSVFFFVNSSSIQRKLICCCFSGFYTLPVSVANPCHIRLIARVHSAYCYMADRPMNRFWSFLFLMPLIFINRSERVLISRWYSSMMLYVIICQECSSTECFRLNNNTFKIFVYIFLYMHRTVY